nr:hypothetical protein [Deltaproteobacteria bacterium]
MKWLVVAIALAVTGCDRVDCFDNGPNEAGYREGEDTARAENAASFTRGKTAGLALTRADGEADGLAEGYDDGFATGFDRGYGVGYSDGVTSGSLDGANDPGACAAGASAGLSDGEADGHTDSYDGGFADGNSAGYEAGFAEGVATCDGNAVRKRAPAEEEEPRPGSARDGLAREVGVCRDRGYLETLDATAYAAGLAEGKRDNPDYQAGYGA